MPRFLRAATGGVVYHVLNRANGGFQIFLRQPDYEAFEKVLAEARERVDMRILAYCVMPTHWHLVLWPREDDDMPAFMAWLTTTHVQRYNTAHGQVGAGHLYQGRYKSFPVQSDYHFLTVCRYVERNPLTAGCVPRAQEWVWSSLWRRLNGDQEAQTLLTRWPVERSDDWITLVNEPMTDKELGAIQTSIVRNRPYGSARWQRNIARRLGLESTLKPRGRPRSKKGV